MVRMHFRFVQRSSYMMSPDAIVRCCAVLCRVVLCRVPYFDLSFVVYKYEISTKHRIESQKKAPDHTQLSSAQQR